MELLNNSYYYISNIVLYNKEPEKSDMGTYMRNRN
ncbi:unknown [Coraliomargarita sp. CAG:312]|nr:unknown [Coraliomargarita sp. CAG:312]